MRDYEKALEELERKQAAARKKRRRRGGEPPRPSTWKRVVTTIMLVVLSALGYAAKTLVDGDGGETHADESHTARCRDGSYSDSPRRSGTCSSHGGVKAWINLPEY